MRVNEIFHSIDGEGVRAGELATFIRLAGCNLRCYYCDTCYALKTEDGVEMSISKILDAVKAVGIKNITLTGGEPLLWKESLLLVKALTEAGFNVNIETNGSFDAEEYMMDNTIITMDYKTKSSGMQKRMNLDFMRKLRSNDVLKFVVGEFDMDEVVDVIRDLKPNCYVYFSPIFGQIEPSKLVDMMVEMHEEGIYTSKMKVQLQLHKYIWSPEERGV